jgi:hypothetical protein
MRNPEDQQARRRPSVFSIAGPLLMGVLFFCVVTPAALFMRLAGHDRLRLRLDRTMPSYWIARPAAGRRTAMTRQF